MSRRTGQKPETTGSLLPGFGLRAARSAALAAAICSTVLTGIAQVPIELRVADEVAPPGGTALMFVGLTEPEPISGGKTRVRYSAARIASAGLVPAQTDLLAQPTRVDLLSSSDVVTGDVTISGGTVSIELEARDATFGTEQDLPLIALAIPVSPSAKVGETVTVEIELASLTGPGGTAYSVGTKSGVFTVGGTSVTTISPYRGALGSGSTITMFGVGFEPGAEVRIEGADVRDTLFVSSGELQVRLDSALEIRNTTRFRVRNPSRSEDVYYPIDERPAPPPPAGSIQFLSQAGQVLKGVIETIEVEIDLPRGGEVLFESSDPDVLGVDPGVSVPSGKVRHQIRCHGRLDGTVSLTARSGSIQSTIPVVVVDGSAYQIPVPGDGTGNNLGLAITNGGGSPAVVDIRGFSSGGGNPLDLSFELGPYQQQARFLEEFDPRLKSLTGWLEVSSHSSAVHALFIDVPRDLVRYPGAAGTSTGVRQSALTFPGLEGSYELLLVNNNLEAATVTLSWSSASGTTLYSETLEIASQQSLMRRSDELPPGDVGLALENVTLLLESSVPLLAYQRLNGSPFVFGRVAANYSASGVPVVLPRFLAGEGWETVLDIVNGSDAVCSLQVELEAQEGAGFPAYDATLQPWSSLRIQATDIVGAGLLTAGSARIIAPCPAAVSAVIVRNTGVGLATPVQSYQSEVREYVFAQVANGLLGSSALFTGMALANVAAEAAQVEVAVFSAEGTLRGQAGLMLEPGESMARLLSELIPDLPAQFGGHVRISSNRPVVAVEIFGDYDLSFLSTVPASSAPSTEP